MAVLVAGCAGSGSDKAGGKSARRPVVLTLANFLGDSEELDGFAADVRRLSGGTIRIDVESRWRYGQVDYEDGLIGDVRAGRADLGIAGSRAWDSVGVNSLRALATPFLINSYALQQRVLQSRLIPQMLSGLAPLGLVGLGVLPGPLRYPFGVVRPLLGPSDYTRLRIGVQQSRVGNATLRALGATPVPFAVGAPISAFAGVEQQISSVQNQYEGVAGYLTANVVLWPRPLVVFTSRRTLARLTPAQWRILTQAATDDLEPETRVMQEDDEASTAAMCRVGALRFVTASHADLVALRRAVQPVYAELNRDPQTRRFIARIQAMRSEVPLEPVERCGHSASALTGTSALAGVWEMTTRYGDEPSDPDPVPENYGDWIFVFDDGHFADTQVYLNACTWGYGTYTATGKQMARTFTDGGGIAPTGAENRPGEFFRFGWSLYRDTLIVTPVQGAVSPVNFRGKPWHRISPTPSWQYFSRRCLPPAKALPGS